MKLILLILSSLYGIGFSHKMGVMITCLEQNDESPFGFRDPIWLNPQSEECQLAPDLYEKYREETCEDDPKLGFKCAGKGDTCDHTDPRTGIRRDTCKVAIMFGAVQDPEKTWSWKCWERTQCPVIGDDGKGTVGCKVNRKRIQCCCDEDFCTGEQIYQQLAAYGRDDHYPPNYEEILKLFDERCDIKLVVDIPGYQWDGRPNCDTSQSSQPSQSSESSESTESSQSSESSESSESTESAEATESTESNPSTTESSESAESTESVNIGYSDKAETTESVKSVESTESVSNDDVNHGWIPPGFAKSIFKQQPQINNPMRGSNLMKVGDILLIFTYFVVGILCLGIGVFIGSKWKTNVEAQQMKMQQFDI